MHRAKRRRTKFTVEDEHGNPEAGSTHEDDVYEYPGESDGSEYGEQEERTHRHGRRGRITARATRATRRAKVEQTGSGTADRDRDRDREGVDDENGGARKRRLTVYDTVAAGRRTVGTRTAQALAMAGADAAMGRRVYRGAHTMPAADEVLGSRAARVVGRGRGRGRDNSEQVAEDASCLVSTTRHSPACSCRRVNFLQQCTRIGRIEPTAYGTDTQFTAQWTDLRWLRWGFSSRPQLTPMWRCRAATDPSAGLAPPREFRRSHGEIAFPAPDWPSGAHATKPPPKSSNGLPLLQPEKKTSIILLLPSPSLFLPLPNLLKADPFLSLAVDNISKLDTSDAENLFSIWTVFSKCAENLENGRRLENLSWRLWNREAFVANNGVHSSSKSASCSPCPDLSSSVESVSSDHHAHAPKPSRPPMQKSNTTDRFQKVIETFNIAQEEHWKALRSEQLAQQQKQKSLIANKEIARSALVAPEQPSVSVSAQKPVAVDIPIPEQPLPRSADTSDSESDSERHLSRAALSSTSIVRGFSPSAISVHSVRSELFIAPPRSRPQPVSKNDSASGFAARVAARNAGAKKKMFFIESSPSESDGFGESVSPAGNGMGTNGQTSNFRSSFGGKKPPPAASSAFSANGGHKRTSFREEVVTIPSSGEIEDDEDDDIEDDDEDMVSESAIDDAESDWDSVDESGPPSFDESSFFVREERPMITSRPSILSTLLHTEPDRATLATVGSRSTPAIAATYAQQNSSRSSKIQQQLLQQQQQIASSRRASATAHHNQPAVVPIPEHSMPSESVERESRSSKLSTTTEPVIVPVTASSVSIASKSQPALSPRSTRRNMLATELSESLRRNLLWERQQKNATTAALLKRRHTSHDVANLTHYPGPSRAAAGSRYGDRAEFDHTEFGYHARGW
ncbi:hypothetical protein V1515DRAFT_614112 [Lipomyces mesembrius]